MHTRGRVSGSILTPTHPLSTRQKRGSQRAGAASTGSANKYALTRPYHVVRTGGNRPSARRPPQTGPTRTPTASLQQPPTPRPAGASMGSDVTQGSRCGRGLSPRILGNGVWKLGRLRPLRTCRSPRWVRSRARRVRGWQSALGLGVAVSRPTVGAAGQGRAGLGG